MAAVQHLRRFVSERLSAAAEEIIRVFEKTIADYEEELGRQGRLLESVGEAHVKLQRIDLQQLSVCKQEEGLGEQRFCKQERSHGLDQEGPEWIKEEACSTHGGELVEVKQEIDSIVLIRTGEESGDQSLDSSRADSRSEERPLVRSSEAHPVKHLPLHSSPADESRDHNPSKTSTYSHNLHAAAAAVLQTNDDPYKIEKSYKCDTCGKVFMYLSVLHRHMITHTGEKPYCCSTCGKRFSYLSVLKRHMRIHTGEKPYSCKTCGRSFRENSDLKSHMRTHTGEKPHSCSSCDKKFYKRGELIAHLRIHTGEKPYACNSCDKRFFRMTHLKTHVRIHTGEKLCPCTCGKRFSDASPLRRHMRIHTGERPYPCGACEKSFSGASGLKKHRRTHTGEKPYPCDACEKNLCHVTDLEKTPGNTCV